MRPVLVYILHYVKRTLFKPLLHRGSAIGMATLAVIAYSFAAAFTAVLLHNSVETSG